MPSAACTRVAVAGNVSSGVAVASTIRSRSPAFSAGMVERALRGLGREVRGELAVGCDVALADAGALLDPLVGGIHLLGQIGVGDDPLRQIGAASLNDRTDHAVPPLACSASSGESGAEVTWRSLARPSTSLLLYS